MGRVRPLLAKSPGHERRADAVIACALVLLTAYHLALTLSTVVTYELASPFMDQFRLTLRYATTPFPESVLALENGHRPILPGIVRVLELRFLGGRQLLQVITAWGSALAMLAIIAWRAAIDFRGDFVRISAALCGSFTFLAWNANDRMFIHPYEAVHVFYVMLALAVAVLAAIEAQRSGQDRWWWAVVGACTAATFTFGTGIATFPALLALAVVSRCRWQVITGIALSMGLVFIAYFYLLPGAEGVRNTSSGIRAGPLVFFAFARLAAVFVEIPRPFVADELSRMMPALGMTLVAVVATSCSVVRRWRAADPFSSVELLGIALFFFGAATNLLICANRIDYFFENTNQLYADRYLYWSCAFWAGVLLYGTSRMKRRADRTRWAVAVGLLSVSAIPVALWLNAWSSEVHRHSELSGVAMTLGINDPSALSTFSDVGEDVTIRAIDAMRSASLFAFSGPSKPRVDSKIRTDPTSLDVVLSGRPVRPSVPGGRTPMYLSGTLPERESASVLGATLWLTDENGVVAGRLALTAGGQRIGNILRLGVPAFRAVEGYVVSRDYRRGFLVADDGNALRTIARVSVAPATARGIK